MSFLLGVSLSPLHWPRWIIQILPLLALLVAFGTDTAVTLLVKHLKPGMTAPSSLVVLGILMVSAWPTYRSVAFILKQSNPSTRILAREWVLENLPPGSSIVQEKYTAPLDGTDYVVHEESWNPANRTLDSYRRNGYHYVMINRDMFYNHFVADEERYREQVKFYRDLFSSGRLLQEFRPSTTRDGPMIQVYEIGNWETRIQPQSGLPPAR